MRKHRARGGSRLVNNLAFLAVAAVVATGLLVTSREQWREGLYVVGGGALLAAALRLCLPARRAGMLAVRGRILDAVTLTGLGAAVIVLAAVVPEG